MNYLLSHNQVLQTLLLQKDSHIKPHRNLTPETSKDIEQLSRKVGLAPTQSRILFTTGIGLSDRGFPLRIAAIIIPTLRVIGRLQALGIPNISYRIYQATDFIIDENGLDREKGIQVARILQNYIHEYIQNHHKELEDSIDMQFSLGLKGELIDDVALELSHMHHPSLEKLAHYAQSKGKSLQSAYRYAAANIVSNGHVSDRFPVKNHPSDDLIVVG